MGVLNLVHELMHSFGAKHDPDQAAKPECTPDDKVVLSNLAPGVSKPLGPLGVRTCVWVKSMPKRHAFLEDYLNTIRCP